ncbi:MAG: TolC family protein [Candidatus Delongbacteria bacterium]|nr:TolC family protein [Candidatus Delongbacteria bacterium]
MKKVFIMLVTIITVASSAKIDLNQAQESALEKNYNYAITKQNVISSELSTKSAFAGFFPTANLSSSYMMYVPEVEGSSFNPLTMSSVNFTQEDRTAFGIQISQPLFLGGKKYYGYQISKDSESISRNKLSAEMISLLSDVEAQYINVLEMKELFDISKESLELSKRNEESAKIKFESGLTSRADFLKSSSARASSEVNVVNSERGYELAKISFTNLTGLNDFDLEKIELATYQGFIDKLKDVNLSKINDKANILKDIALKNNNDLKNIHLTKMINEKSIKMTKGNFLPSVNLSYSTEWSKSNLDDEYNNNGSLVLSASMPILPFYDNYIVVEKSKIELKKMEITEMQMLDNLATMINSSLYSLISGSKQLYSSILAVELAEETYFNVEERAKSGISTEDELNTARLSLVQAKYNQVSSYYSILKTKSELMKVLGISDEKELVELF